MMLIDKKDQLRTAMGISSGKPAEAIVKRNHPQFCIPMPAIGESVLKLRQKNHDNFIELMREFDRLLNSGFFVEKYLSEEAFSLASILSKVFTDDRDRMTPMDSLILACAVVDQECDAFYTKDSTLLASPDVSSIASDYRTNHNMSDLRIDDFENILSTTSRKSSKKRHRRLKNL